MTERSVTKARVASACPIGARTSFVVAVQTTVVLALAWTAHAWVLECDLARSGYEVAYAEWLAVSERLDCERGPDAVALRRADEEAGGYEAAVERHRALSTAWFDQQGLAEAEAARIGALATARDDRARVADEARAAIAELVARATQAANTCADAVAFRNRAANNLRETVDELTNAGAAIDGLRGRIAKHIQLIKDYEGLLTQAKERGVPVERLAAGSPRRPRSTVAVIERVDLGASLLQIDVGQADGVLEGTTLEVYRGDRYICSIKVRTVNDDEASASILSETTGEGRQPQPGDRVLLPPPRLMPGRIRGVVEKVDLGMFLMDVGVGRRDGACEGMQLTVFRGDQYLCKIQLKTVREGSSVAWILVETMVQGRQPQPGDQLKDHD